MPRRASLAALVVVLSIASSSLRAAESPPSEPILLSVAGRVVDPEGKPVEGAHIVLREWSSVRYGENVFSAGEDLLAETVTGAEGQFRFEGVNAKPFSGHTHYAAPWDVVAFAAGYAPTWSHLPKAVVDKPLDLTLRPACRITGRLVDAAGEPIADCPVKVASFSKPSANPQYDHEDPQLLDLWRSKVAPTTATDAAGNFELVDVPEDSMITLTTEHPRFTRGIFAVQTTAEAPAAVDSSAESHRDTRLPPPTYTSGFTHKLDPGGQLRGRVVYGDTGKPAADAKITVQGQNQHHFAKANANGSFRLDSLPLSKFSVSVHPDEPGYLGVQSQIEFTNDGREQKVALEYARGKVVCGKVVDAESGAGVPSVTVSYWPPNADENSNWTPVRPVESKQDGAFEIIAPAGAGLLRVGGGIEAHPTHDVPNFWRWRSKEHLAEGASVAIDVSIEKPLDDVRLAVTRGLVVRGQVVDAAGQPIPLVKVEALDRFGRSESAKKTHTDETGRFELTGFPPHEALRLNFADSVGRLRTAAEVAEDPTAGASRVADLGAVTLRGTAILSGTVMADGKPLAGATVRLNVFGKQEGEYVTSRQDAIVTTDDAGRYTIGDVATGEEFALYVNCHGYTEQGTKKYKLAAGETLEVPPVEIKSRSAAVGGIVVDFDGHPIANVTVSAWERDGYSSVPYGPEGPPPPTGPDGRFRLTDLPNVPLRLMAYIQPPNDTRERSIRFPATVPAEPGQMDVRIRLDPKLQRPLP